ncbi:MAG: hypothetical protein JOY60_11070 [Burkholderiaceae bacterium]|nr:hypothetical protein [Roseateles sp.]MBV8470384.1 hypothetical protein [Burkholderiaceae bacterium]
MMSYLLSRVLRVVLAAVAVLLVLALMSLALVFMLALMLWSLLRGRKPVLDFSSLARARAFGASFQGARASAARHDVVDVEARDVSGSTVSEGRQHLE